jgi:hypothetical protein
MDTVSHRVLDRCTEEDRIRGADPAKLAVVRSELLRRARLLGPEDRRLVEMSVAGCTVRVVATALRRHPGSISRRLSALKRRLCNEVVVAMADHAADLPEWYLRIGIGHYIERRSPRTLARQFGLTQGEVTEVIGYLRAWAMIRRR